MQGSRRGAGDDRALIGWSIALAVALLASAAWLRSARLEYLVVGAIATLAAAVGARRSTGRERGWRVVTTAIAGAVAVALGLAQRDIAAVERSWPRYEARVNARAAGRLHEQLDAAATELARTARAALDAPTSRAGAFEHLRGLGAAAGERGVILYADGVPFAWGGTSRVPTDSLVAPIGVVRTPFYVTLYAAATDRRRRAVATALLHAEPPATAISTPLDAMVARKVGVRGYELTRDSAAAPGTALALRDGGPPLVARVLRSSPEETSLRLSERARVRVGLLTALALAAFVGAVWRARRRLRWRFAALGVALAVLALVPLNELSNVTRLFDPAIYFASLGGPFTASAGALAITGAVLLLGLLALQRSSARVRQRWASVAAVIAIGALGPFLLRNLARGVQPPAEGMTPALWLGWQTALFLAGSVLVIGGASAGRAALGGRRGLPTWFAPALATLAAAAGPALWEAPGRWPGWYTALWALAIIALAFTRRSARFVAAAAVVSSLGASTLVWGATSRKRVELAARDIESLRVPDEYALALLNRFAHSLVEQPAAPTRAELLARYVSSDLAAADYPVELSAWDSTGRLEARVTTAQLEINGTNAPLVVAESRALCSPVIRELTSDVGLSLVLAAPDAARGTTSVTVFPRTRLIPGDPYAPLLGAAPSSGEPPYALSVTGADSLSISDQERPVWKREGNELHGDWLIRTARGLSRAHAEVELRSMTSLAQRGVLIVLADLALVALLWGVSALADGGYARWMRIRRRRWTRSYRSRLTLALFGFFVLPAAVFALWSSRQLRSDDRQSRELLLRESLRGVAAAASRGDLGAASQRLDAPVLIYERGTLAATSDTLYDALAPFGRTLSPGVYLQLGLSDEVTATSLERVGRTPTVVGYRAVTSDRGQRLVLAAPGRVGEEMLDRRRRDLGVLVLFSTALGALAALALSGVAARQFARPLGELRDAALAIAAGDREPALGARPPAEFLTVYNAFRRMAADLGASREALVEARRRTEAVLRDVASGVIAVDTAGTVTLANPRADALLGRVATPGMPLAALGAGAIAERVGRFLQRNEHDIGFEAEHARRQLRVRVTRLTRGTGGAVVTLDDVTELARAQRVLAWGEMARQVAHEIKNPLTPIRLGVQHLRRAFAAKREDFPHILDQNATRILAEIDRLDEIARSFSRYGTAPTEQPGAEPTDVVPIARGIIELEELGEKDVEFTLVGAEVPAVAMARKGELRDVLVNLAENARQAGARRVTLAIAREDSVVRIEVRDDGEGIAPDALPRIFEPHFSTRTSGSGLGLAISRRLVDGWGGSMGVESERGRGTVVRVTLRAAPG